MSKKATIIWCILVGVLDSLYCLLCSMIPHVQNYMWIGFISLPIFFCGGATLKLLPRYFCCAVSGVLWGALTLVILGLGIIADPGLNMLAFVWPVVGLCCVVHIAIFTEDVLGGLLSNCPMVFGGFAAIFSQGNGELPWVVLTLTLGLLLGLAITMTGSAVTKLVDKPVTQKAG